jgi:GLPGLI family protein
MTGKFSYQLSVNSYQLYHRTLSFMKNIIIVLIVMLGITECPFAQQTPQNEGVIRYVRTSRWTKIMEKATYINKEEREKMTYMYSTKDKWDEYTELYFNENTSKYIESDEKKEVGSGYDWRKEVFALKRDFERNTLTDYMEMKGKTYIIEDTIPSHKWKILNDMKEVAGHICMNAMIEDPIKQQKIIAWFAQDFPSSAGPERFSGLPGMILELDINEGAVIISADKIEFKKLTKELDLPAKVKGKKINEAAFQDIIKKAMDEAVKEEQYPWGIRY